LRLRTNTRLRASVRQQSLEAAARCSCPCCSKENMAMRIY